MKIVKRRIEENYLFTLNADSESEAKEIAEKKLNKLVSDKKSLYIQTDTPYEWRQDDYLIKPSIKWTVVEYDKDLKEWHISYTVLYDIRTSDAI